MTSGSGSSGPYRRLPNARCASCFGDHRRGPTGPVLPPARSTAPRHGAGGSLRNPTDPTTRRAGFLRAVKTGLPQDASGRPGCRNGAADVARGVLCGGVAATAGGRRVIAARVAGPAGPAGPVAAGAPSSPAPPPRARPEPARVAPPGHGHGWGIGPPPRVPWAPLCTLRR